MARYELSKKLPSCRVSKELLIFIEDYLKKRTSDLLKSDKDKFEECFSLTMEYPNASESMRTTDEIVGEYFPDDLKAMSIAFRSYMPDLNIRISFSQEASYASKIQIEFSGENAREIVEGMNLALEKIIHPFRTLSGLWHPNMPLSVAIFSLGLYSSVFLFSYLLVKRRVECFYGLIPLLLALIYWLFGKLNPRMLFHTRRNFAIQQRLKWIFSTVAGFILLGLLTVIWKLIFKWAP